MATILIGFPDDGRRGPGDLGANEGVLPYMMRSKFLLDFLGLAPTTHEIAPVFEELFNPREPSNWVAIGRSEANVYG